MFHTPDAPTEPADPALPEAADDLAALAAVEREIGEIEEFSKDYFWETGEVLIPRDVAVGVVRQHRQDRSTGQSNRYADVRQQAAQLAEAAGVPAADVTFLPWLPDGSIIRTSYTPARPRARIDIDASALNDLSPEAWRHLLADAVSDLARHNKRRYAVLDLLPHVSNGALLFGIAVLLYERRLVWPVLLACLAVSAGAALLQAGSWLLLELRATRYAVRLGKLVNGGLDHATVDEILDYTGAGPADAVRRWHLHRLIDRVDRVDRDPKASSGPTAAVGSR